MKREIYCSECIGEIESRYDLVTAYSFFRVIPYHRSCYATALKGCQTIIVGNQPINGASGTITAFLMLVALGFFFISQYSFLTSGGWALIPFLLLVPIARVYSWIRYERHLP